MLSLFLSRRLPSVIIVVLYSAPVYRRRDEPKQGKQSPSQKDVNALNISENDAARQKKKFTGQAELLKTALDSKPYVINLKEKYFKFKKCREKRRKSSYHYCTSHLNRDDTDGAVNRCCLGVETTSLKPVTWCQSNTGSQ